MGVLSIFKGNARLRQNDGTGAMSVIDEDLWNEGRAFQDHLIVKEYNSVKNRIHRHEQCMSNGIFNALTYRWAIIATTKTFKFYTSHDSKGQEIMQEHRAWWQSSNLDEMLRAIIPMVCKDGHCLHEISIDWLNQLIEYEIYGDYECPPRQWDRDDDNNILQYRVHFTPRVRPSGRYASSQSLRSINKIYKKNELLHHTRATKNYDYGESRIIPVWSPAVMIWHAAYADFFRKDNKFIGAVPESWKKARIQRFARTLVDFVRGKTKMLIYKMEQNIASKEPIELPRFGYQPLSAPAAKPMAMSETGSSVRDPNWSLIFTGTGLSETYFVGNQAGTQTGSEVDLTTDEKAETAEFSLYEPIIKSIINWFVERGLVPAPPETFVVKYWKDWEFIEKQAASVERENEIMDKQAETKDRAENNDRAKQHNSRLEQNLRIALKTNAFVPMTSVHSSGWVEEAGAYKGHLLIKTKIGSDIQAYPYPGAHLGQTTTGSLQTPDIAEQKAIELQSAGSPGTWIWDNILKRPSIHGMAAGKLFEKGSKIKHSDPPGRPRPINVTLPTTQQTTQAPSTPQKATPSASISAPSIPTRSSILIPKPVRATNSRFDINDISWEKLSGKLKEEYGQGISKTAFNNLRKHVNSDKRKFRYNTISVGNPIAFGNKMYYDDAPDGELACPIAWKEIETHTGDLFLYENQEHEGRKWNVGKYHYEWNEKIDGPLIVQDRDDKLIRDIHEYLGVNNNEILNRLDNGKEPDISTEYYSNTVNRDGNAYQVDFQNSQGEHKLEGIAIVNHGNCSAPYCNFQAVPIEGGD